MSRLVYVPLPNGHQPTRPPDDPLAELIAEEMPDRYECLLGVRGHPVTPCLLGCLGQCAWGVRTEEDSYCMWSFIRRHPGGATKQEIADALGMSKERIRQWITRALERYECRARGTELEDTDGYVGFGEASGWVDLTEGVVDPGEPYLPEVEQGAAERAWGRSQAPCRGPGVVGRGWADAEPVAHSFVYRAEIGSIDLLA